MSLILSCVELLTAILFICISFQTRDEVGAQINRILGASIFLLSFLFSPLLIKLVMVSACLLAWPYMGARLTVSFYRLLQSKSQHP